MISSFTIHLKSEWNGVKRERKRKIGSAKEQKSNKNRKKIVDLMNETHTHTENTEECVAIRPSERISPHTGVEAATTAANK